MKLRSCLRSFWSLVVRGRLIVSLVAVLAALLGAVWWCGWDWLRTGSGDLESGSTTIRNIGLLVGGGIAIWVAYRRSVISQLGLLNERYQKGAEMLGSEVLAVRLGGIYALQRLVEDHPKQYHVQVMRLFCAFVRNPPVDKDRDDNARPTGTEREPNIKDYQVREDVQAAMTAIGTRSEDDMELEKQGKFSLILNDAQLNGADLTDAYLTDTHLDGAYLNRAYLNGAHLTDAHLNTAQLNAAHLNRAHLNGAHLTCAHLDGAYLIGAYLNGAHLEDAYLIGAHLEDAHLEDAHLNGAHLEDAYLIGAHLNGAYLNGAYLTDAHLDGAYLTGADFSEAKGLTQKKLDQAWADPGNPPQLGGLCDVETGEPLEWRGGVPDRQ